MTKSNIPIRKVCEFCGKEFIAGKITTRFCSKTCNSRAIRCLRFTSLLNEKFDFLDREKLKGDFLAYFKKCCLQISQE